MTLLVAGLLIFFSAHTFSMFRVQRQRLIERIGARPYRGLYSFVALAGLILVVKGYIDAPRIEVWSPPSDMRYVTELLMLPVFVLMVAANLPGRIKAALKNPMLIAVTTWAFAHLLVNGDLASMVLFGSFLIWAVTDLIAVNRSGRGAVVAAPRGAFDVLAVVAGLANYALIVLWGHVYIAGVPLLAPG